MGTGWKKGHGARGGRGLAGEKLRRERRRVALQGWLMGLSSAAQGGCSLEGPCWARGRCCLVLLGRGGPWEMLTG